MKCDHNENVWRSNMTRELFHNAPDTPNSNTRPS